jgi:hypothetical protein
MSWDWRIRRLFISLIIAEDPEKPLMLRTWGRTTVDGKEQEAFILKFSRSVREYDSGERQSAWALLIGPVCLHLALINKR